MAKGGKLKAKIKQAEKEATAKAKRDERLTRKELKRQQARERNYESNEERAFAAQLDALGCKIKIIAGDGNCMFRSLADQIDGDPNNHGEMRKRIMDYIEEHRDHFALFMEEEDEDFDAYVQRMRRDKEWGGHPELYAASQVLQVDIVVHQYNTPRFVLQCERPTKRIHLSYHGEFHYNSVRALSDSMDGVPAPITLHEPPAGVAAARPAAAPTARQSREGAVDLVRQSVPWATHYSVDTALDVVGGDALEAIDLLLAQGDNFVEPSDEDAILAVATATEQLSLEEKATSSAAETTSSKKTNKANKTKSGSKSSRRSAREQAELEEKEAATAAAVVAAEAELGKPLSKKEKRLLKQGRNKAAASSAPTPSLAVQAGEVAI